MLPEGLNSTVTNLKINPDGQMHLKDPLGCLMEVLTQFLSLHYGLLSSGIRKHNYYFVSVVVAVLGYYIK